jgi:Sec-independent protein secretion pathway component TatC
VFIGAGALITLPFVLAILAEEHVSIVASLIVGAVLLFHAGAAFAYAMVRLVLPAVRVPLGRRR